MLLTATRIHNGKHWLPQGTVIQLADDGTITAILSDSYAAAAKHYEGIICPGFVNAHCHLELSHMQGQIPEYTGLVPFLKQVAFTRNDYTEEQKITARHSAFNAMLNNGVVAVGDIANTNDTLDLRSLGKMHFHSFVEALGFTPTPQKQLEYATGTYNNFTTQQQTGGKLLRQSVVPHAPYSVSQQLFAGISGINPHAILSIHNQESLAEDEYYKAKTGAVTDLLHTIGIDDGFFQPTGQSSLQSYMQWLAATHPVILVHNTYTTAADVQAAQAQFSNLHWCLCPNANLYIENTLPDVPMLMQQCHNICIGTDSLSSNHQLSVLAELQTIKQYYPHIDWEDLLRYATHNGAQALQMEEVIGTIAPGKQPGLVLLDNNFERVVAVI